MEFLTNHIKIIADAKIKINRKEKKNKKQKRNSEFIKSERERREKKKCSGLRTIAQFLDFYFKISED